jgi:BirA family transcriptional regulator, biotin operon repressor / biotin---[acetyl-CoA-carboxylase] ligase
LKSNPSDLPTALADLLARSRARLEPFNTVHYFSEVPSTNDVAALLAEGTVVLADRQTAGRGRRGHSWFSPPGSGLYASVVLAPSRSSDPKGATVLLTLAAGVALAEGVDAASGLRADLKWPNDLYVSRRKLAGILAEASSDRVVLGFGINTSVASYPPDLHGRVTSIESELGRSVDRYPVFVETLVALSRRYDDLLLGRFDAILDAWRRRAPAAVGARVACTVDGNLVTGLTAGVDDRGALLVRVGDRLERIMSGEIQWL